MVVNAEILCFLLKVVIGMGVEFSTKGFLFMNKLSKNKIIIPVISKFAYLLYVYEHLACIYVCVEHIFIESVEVGKQ